MLMRLVRTYLAPYAAPLAAVVVLQFVGTMAALYLPSLNADIIDNGVVTGDTGYIVRLGGLMLGGLAASRSSARSSPSGSPRATRWASAATCAPRSSTASAGSPPARSSSSVRPSLITRETNDVQQVQMLVLMGGTLMVAGADHDDRRHHHGRCARTSACPGWCSRSCRCSASRSA